MDIKELIILIKKDILTKEEAWDHISIEKKEDNTSKNPVIIDEKIIDLYFDYEYYLENNDDLMENNITTQEKLIKHWRSYGKYEDRKYRICSNKYLKDIPIENFDWKYYIKNNLDLVKYDIIEEEKAWEHWNNFGKNEDRKYRYLNDITFDNFDFEYYESSNPDLIENKYSNEQLWEHWNNNGIYEDRLFRIDLNKKTMINDEKNNEINNEINKINNNNTNDKLDELINIQKNIDYKLDILIDKLILKKKDKCD